jgi:outer membrane protein assembly factor BamB
MAMNRYASRGARALAAATPLLLAAALLPTSAARAGRMLVTYDEAARHGLERAWFAQVPIDASRSRVTTWYLHADRLYSVSDSGLVTALNAETGAQLWTQQIGKPGVAAFGPESNAKYLGVVSGSRLYLLEVETGRLKWSRELGSAPSSGPALSNDYVYVAMVTGRIEGYKIDDPNAQPWYYQSKGRTYLRPTTTGSVVSWPTSEGYLYVSGADKPGVKFRLETKADIVTSPAEMDPYLYIASLDGYLYCVNETSGNEEWRYSTGYPIQSSPAIVGKNVYVASIEPELHCLDAATGSHLWQVAGVSHFGAQGKDRIYASDRYGALVILDAKTGSLVGRMPTAQGLQTLVNDQSDRIFLVNDRGLVQCLREIGSVEPTYYRKAEPAEPPAEDAESSTEGAKPTTGEGEAPNPFKPDDAAKPADEPAAEEDAPEAAEEPAPPEEDNPFE